jgi:hypothetical protein
MTSMNSGAGFEADIKVVGEGLSRREAELALARVAGAKPDGASMNARRVRTADEGTLRERAYLASRNLLTAPVRQREAALVELAMERDRDERHPETRVGKRRARSGL